MTVRSLAVGASACLVFAVTACVELRPEPYVSPSVLNASPNQFDRRHISVRGYMVIRPEGHVIYESRELHDQMERQWQSSDYSADIASFDGYCLTIANPGFVQQRFPDFRVGNAVISGTFIKDYLDDRTIDLGACALPTAIIVESVSLVR